MRHAFFISTLLACALLLVSARSFALTYQPMDLQLLRPAAFQIQSIEADGPVSHSVLASDGSLWLLSKTLLWRWYPLTGILQKIQLGSEIPLKSKERMLGAMGDAVYLALDGQLWKLNGASGEVELFAGRWKSDCQNSRFAGLGDRFAVYNDCGAWQIDRYGRKLLPLVINSSGKSWSSSVAIPGCECLFVTNGRDLLKLTSERSRVEVTHVYTAKAKLLGVAWDGEHIVTWTPHALMVFDVQTNKRLQVVPSEGQRRIVSAAFSPALHTILFDDGAVEWMAPPSRRAWSSRLPGGGANQVILDPAGAFAVFPGVSTPTVVNLESFGLTPP